MTRFDGGEGIWHDGGVLYFTTKGDKRRLGLQRAHGDPSRWSTTTRWRPDASLDAVDNITVSAAGEIFVCEDGGNMEIGLITPEREVSPFLRFTGPAHPVEGEFKSEVCGVDLRPVRARACTARRSGAHPPDAERARARRGVRDQRAVQAAGRRTAASPFGMPAGRAARRAAAAAASASCA